MAYKIAVANIKGGCGKTTTAVNIADQLMRKKKRVLMIDTDTQRNATVTYGAQVINVATLDDIFRKGFKAEDCIQSTPYGDIIAGDDALLDADTSIKPGPKMYKYIQKALENVEDKYDYIIFDTAPRFGILLGNVLQASDGVIVPLEADIFNVQGIKDVCEVIDEYREDNPNLRILGFLKIKYKGKQNLTTDIEENILPQFTELYNTKVFKHGIRESVRCKEAQAQQMRLSQYKPYSTVALDYMGLVEELLEDIEK